MTPTSIPIEAPAQPENITPINGAPEPRPRPTDEEIAAAQTAIQQQMAEAAPFNRLAVHTTFQTQIQGAVAKGDLARLSRLCTSFRDWSEAESLAK